jgi:hypothetical protein
MLLALLLSAACSYKTLLKVAPSHSGTFIGHIFFSPHGGSRNIHPFHPR